MVSQRHLLHQVWGPAYQTETDYLRQYLKYLRRKLEDNPSRPRHLLTEPGIGHRFQVTLLPRRRHRHAAGPIASDRTRG